MRPRPRRLARRLLLGAALASAGLWPAAADWSPYPAVHSPCETARIHAGRPEARWAWLAGVHEDEHDRRGRLFVWTARRWRARLLLTEGGERTLRLVGGGSPPGQTLRAFWNGVDLGRQEVPEGRVTLSWPVPAAVGRIGLNELRFEASRARERDRQLAFRLERLEVDPVGGDCAAATAGGADEAFELGPGAVLLVQRPLPPRTRLEIEITAEPGSVVEMYFGRHAARRRFEIVGAGEPRVEHLDLGESTPTDLVAVARGPGSATLRLLGVAGDDSATAWRAACGLRWQLPSAAAGLLVLLALAVAAGRRWPGGRATLWIDCGILLALALALRFAFLDAYPTIDVNRFGDSWEYLRRSRHLMRGASIWSDTSWHAWLSWMRPPGYYVLLAAVLGPGGGGLSVLVKIQAVLLAATAAAGYLAAYPLFGRGAALAAGLLLAVYPQTITSATWILSDPLSLFLTTAGLACLSWLAVRPRWPLALATGAVFGVACLVRSAPLYFVPLAALLLFVGQRPPRRRSPALVLAAGALLVVLPWCVRNSLLYGKPMGIDDLVIPNFLMAHPDPEILPAEVEMVGVWDAPEETRELYFRYLWRANQGGRLTRASGRILGRGLLRMAASPQVTLHRFGQHLRIYFQAFPRVYSAHFLGERDGCRVSSWTDALNLLYGLTLVLAVPGALLALRRRQAWPLLAWILYFVVVTNLFFYPSYMPGRYRLPIFPALAVLAGLAISRAGAALAAYRERRLTSGG